MARVKSLFMDETEHWTEEQWDEFEHRNDPPEDPGEGQHNSPTSAFRRGGR